MYVLFVPATRVFTSSVFVTANSLFFLLKSIGSYLFSFLKMEMLYHQIQGFSFIHNLCFNGEFLVGYNTLLNP